MLNLVGNDVVNATGSRQQPWQSSSPIPEFCFAGCRTPGSNNELLALISGIGDSFRLGDFGQLQRQIPLSVNERVRLQHLFEQYDQIHVQVGKVAFMDNQRRASVSLRLTKAVTAKGNGIFPADSWRDLTLTAEKPFDEWRLTSIRSDYLSTTLSDQTIDIIAPMIDLDAIEIISTENRATTLKIRIVDTNGVDAAALYYRDSGATIAFRSMPLENTQHDASFKATLPETGSASGKIEFYIEAIDAHGNRAQSPETPAYKVLTLNTVDSTANKPVVRTKRRWLYLGLGILAAGALAAQSGNSGDTGNNDARPVIITTVLP